MARFNYTKGKKMTYSIANAARTLEELLGGLDQAYWEAATIERKDFFYDIISAVQGELSEVGKLSVQDHHLDYEPITLDFKAARAKLSRLRKLLDEYVPRSSTSMRLESLISDAVALFGR
jgi:antirestriction protein